MVLGCWFDKAQLAAVAHVEWSHPCQTTTTQMQAVKLLMKAQDVGHTKVVELKHANDAAVDIQAEEGRETRVKQAAFEQTQGL